MVLVVMGPSGAGKTTVGRQLAAALGSAFVDADDLHAPESIAKMASGAPLEETDRGPWLSALALAIEGWVGAGEDVVLACSALRRSHRCVLERHGHGAVRFVHLVVPPETLASRLRQRAGHFMPGSLLASQLATLEPPADAISVDGAARPEVVVTRIREALAEEVPR